MCWNKEVSIITFITVIVFVIILLRRNVGSDRHLAIFSAAFVIIQLLEFFAWLSIEKKDRKLNGLVTRLILICLWIQPLINTFMALKEYMNPTNQESSDSEIGSERKPEFFQRILLIVMIGIFVILLLIALANGVDKNQRFETKSGSNCHLVWKRTNKSTGTVKTSGTRFMADHTIFNIMYLAGLFIPLLFVKPLKKGVVLAFLGLILLVISRKMGSRDEFSSWWCWIAGVFVIAALILKSK